MEPDGRLAPAYFSPNYKYFDQFLQTVKNETTVWIQFSKVFYKHQLHHWFLYFMQKREYHDFPSKIFLSLGTEKFRRGTLVFQKISGTEKC